VRESKARDRSVVILDTIFDVWFCLFVCGRARVVGSVCGVCGPERVNSINQDKNRDLWVWESIARSTLFFGGTLDFEVHFLGKAH
jgi:hypothetical protein